MNKHEKQQEKKNKTGEFIKLSPTDIRHESDALFLGAFWIISIEQKEKQCILRCMDGKEHHVRESAEEIFKMIDAAKNRRLLPIVNY